MIEETVPVDKIFIDRQENEDGGALPFTQLSSSKLRKHIEDCHKVLVDQDLTPEQAWDILADFEGFRGTEAQAIIVQIREEDN